MRSAVPKFHDGATSFTALAVSAGGDCVPLARVTLVGPFVCRALFVSDLLLAVGSKTVPLLVCCVDPQFGGAVQCLPAGQITLSPAGNLRLEMSDQAAARTGAASVDPPQPAAAAASQQADNSHKVTLLCHCFHCFFFFFVT
ncbi:unnamed protein product [Gongylonema pulchrum]|uniref:TAXi_C domain-containing protein n=1 Tax=Gongylonema pulchrum TaxID=637853 RepID=A0A183F148_9BILA|nr:unnamed protein product [Gongylonema pulchrum]